ncbi:sialidase family protein [Mucilaginibacter arboris]|uniref:exo-alpha-sialidase n=1 Tax=Mucilaginibacter arboris TaxID=2682090 RepID=A0A7K1ST14_9SPHI|nr:sialidase family protein [Mucilaginibacter arboris]MVN20441.1 glycosyl hydrolase [Mucilaginibacter arboris]
MKLKRYISTVILLILLSTTGCTPKIYNNKSAGAIKVLAVPTVNPIFKRIDNNPYLRIEIDIPQGNKELDFQQFGGTINPEAIKDVSRLELYLGNENAEFTTDKLLGSTVPSSKKFNIRFNIRLSPGRHILWLSVNLKDDANIDDKLTIKADQLIGSKGLVYKVLQPKTTDRYLGIALRKPYDENVHTYRIPGIVTTDKGTLIAVYDIRYDNDRDLPGNIDVGMSRSTDGGKNWESMKNIIDMGGPKDNSGAGDPSVLFDPVTRTIWVVALWSKGNHSIAGSGPGLTPDETGQIVITSSTDDGITWAKPYSITAQVKNPEWKIFFQGPGNGIAMQDGKIVFPAQYWDAKKVPYSTLIYSGDHGKSWKSGIGAKSNTTEAQLVETTPGTLMLNMRDNRGGFRSVATTKDMGQSWTEHATSRSALPDPVCMASLIKANVNVQGSAKDLLFFSNLNTSKAPREHTTIKASLDLGETWQPNNQLFLDERKSYGYSDLTRIDKNTLGILYEGIRSLLFVRIPVKDIVK